MKTILLFAGLLSTNSLFTQIVGSNVYLKGTYVELGMNDCGVYCSSDLPPAGYHSNFPVGLSFIADRDMDGWDMGSPNYCGDYALPAVPLEGWSLQMGDDVWTNTDMGCWPNEISGSITDYTISPSTITATWEGDLMSPDIHIHQLTILNVNDLYFITTITISNESAAPLSDLYYMRNIDPDPEAEWGGGFTTNNTVISNPPDGTDALVESEGLTYGCHLGIGARNLNARATFGNFATLDGTPSNVWHGEEGYNLEGTLTVDLSNSIAFYIPNIPVGESTSITFAYILSPSATEAALAATTEEIVCNPPTSITVDPATTSATVSWPPVAGASSYVFKYRPSGAGPWTTLPLASSTVNLTELTACTGYDYRAGSLCEDVSSTQTTGSFTTDCILCESAPTGLFADNIGTTFAKLHWNANPDAIKYKVSYGPVGDAAAVINAASNMKKVTTLTPGTTYLFRVRSICADGSSPYSTAGTFTTLLKLSDSPLVNASLTIYPNPVSDQVMMNMLNFADGPMQLKLYDILGNTIMEKEIQIIDNPTIEELTISGIPDGLYLLSAEQNGFSINTQVMIAK